MLLEAGDRQPRNLAEAYRRPCDPQFGPATEALAGHLTALDEAYATGEERRAMLLSNETDIPGAERRSLADLAEWTRALPGRVAA